MSSSFLDVQQPVTYALLLRPETQKIEPSTDVLKGILRPVVEGVKEISWPPRDPEAINQMEKVCTRATVMAIVDCVVNKTRSSTDVLKGILRPVAEGVEEISWPPRDPEAINQMEKAEGCFQAKEDKDKPRLAAKLQKVLQLYAATVLSKRSYAKKGTFLKSLAHSKLPLSTNRISSRLHPITGNQVVKVDHFLETLIKCLFVQPYFPCSQSTQRSSHLVYYVFPAPEEQWNKFFLEGLTLGKSEITPEELSAVIKKQIERTLIRTKGGSYQQRILIEYLKGIESRANEII
ncbi:hypothetical protein F2Q68_00022309 [Brassica cretica]|uniref:Uncharacterized protein n=1 Tax=Brassica cretica TaxID=69181 RepID=A0A8S9G3Z7_BRACR|nr:hypothetical protein F2Q68_00022309 [Brassica cretica]